MARASQGFRGNSDRVGPGRLVKKKLSREATTSDSVAVTLEASFITDKAWSAL